MFQINRRLLWLRSISAVVISAERLGYCGWRLLTWCLLFAALWMFGLPAALGGFVEGITFLSFVIGMAYFIYQDVFTLRLPSIHEIDRRIERDSGVFGRPLTEMNDSLANNDCPTPVTRNLWMQSKSWLLGLMSRLRPARLHLSLSKHDPYALRLIMPMLFIFALLWAGPDAGMRMRTGLIPFSFSTDHETQMNERFLITISAPKYTRMGDVIIRGSGSLSEDRRVDIPQGSQVKISINDGFALTRIFGSRHSYINADIREVFDETLDVRVPDIANAVSAQDGVFRVKQGIFPLARIPYRYIPDLPPQIAAAPETQIEALDNGSLSFALSVYDDYSVEFLDMNLTLDSMVDQPPLGSDVMIRRVVMSPAAQDFEIKPNYDLSWHLWAGLPVEIRFSARDDLGQSVDLPPIKTILPEREFKHPIAKSLVTLRKQLAWNPRDQATYDQLSYDLLTLLGAKDMMHDDMVVYMGIRSAGLRLHHNAPSIKTAQEITSLLWDIALRVEDGDLSLAARHLRDIQQALQDALDNPQMGEDDIAALMDALNQAMSEYFQELGREMQKRMAEGDALPEFIPNLNQDSLRDFLAQMEQAMRDGNRDIAQQMLSQMQRMLDMAGPSMNTQMPTDMQMMQDGVNELQELIDRQQLLLDQTNNQIDILETLHELQISPDGYEGAAPFVDTAENKVEQDALRYVLGALMAEADSAMGEIPESMQNAEGEMRRSSSALEMNAPQESAPHQEAAIEYLKESQDDLAQQLQQRMMEMTGLILQFKQQQIARDPLGRPMPNDGQDGDRGLDSQVSVPDEAERRHVQEILRLLRDRSGDQTRPREELEYYRRLLKQF